MAGKLGITYQLELNISGLSIDIALPHQRIAVEADGPHHYMYNFAPGTGDLIIEDPSSIVAVNGTSIFKARLMRAMGWHPISVPFFEFEAFNSRSNPSAVTAEHERYMVRKLREGGHEGGQGDQIDQGARDQS